MKKNEQFIKYFLSFYGPQGLYPMQGWTLSQLELAIQMRGDNFEGDSIDREAIRDILKCANNQMGGINS